MTSILTISIPCAKPFFRQLCDQQFLQEAGLAAIERARRGRPHKAKDSEPRKQIGFRPSQDVYEMVTAAASQGGLTINAEIDATLRLTYQRKTLDLEQLMDGFGGAEGFAFGFLMARIRSGVEHECQQRASASAVVREQVQRLSDIIISRMVDSPTARSEPVAIVESKYSKSLPSAADMEAEVLKYIEGAPKASDQPWRRVFVAIHRNLHSDDSDLWWPLSDLPAGKRRSAQGQPPLRPTKEQLLAVWPFPKVKAAS